MIPRSSRRRLTRKEMTQLVCLFIIIITLFFYPSHLFVAQAVIFSPLYSTPLTHVHPESSRASLMLPQLSPLVTISLLSYSCITGSLVLLSSFIFPFPLSGLLHPPSLPG